MTTMLDQPQVQPRRPSGRWWAHALVFAAAVLLVNAVFGERGLMESLRARRAYADASEELARVRQQNARLRDQIRRLRSDPATIESVARHELGLAKRGEIVVTVRDLARQGD
jgi:cell division protein FtsB